MEELKNENLEETETLASDVELNDETTVEEGDVLTQGVMAEKNMQKVTAQQRVMKVLVQVGLYLFLGIMALIVIFPFYWMIISSLKSLAEYELTKPTFFPKEIHFENYANAFKDAEMGRLFLNTRLLL